MIETYKMVKDYGENRALNGLSMKIEKGELFGLIGPSGAGKTTAMRILATLILPSGGTARIGGLNVSVNKKRIRRIIGYMPDMLPVFDDLTVSEFLYFYALNYGLRGKKCSFAVSRVMTLTGMNGFKRRPTSKLSRGMRQKLALARALVHSPETLILDEPASGLDPQSRIELKGLLKHLSAEGVTVLYSSHILSEVAGISDRIGIIDHGRLVASGSMEKLLESAGTRKTINLRVKGDFSKAAAVLNEAGTLGGISLDEEVLKIRPLGRNYEISTIPSVLNKAGITVESIYETRAGLEDLFLAFTADEAALAVRE